MFFTEDSVLVGMDEVVRGSAGVPKRRGSAPSPEKARRASTQRSAAPSVGGGGLAGSMTVSVRTANTSRQMTGASTGEVGLEKLVVPAVGGLDGRAAYARARV